MEFERSVLKVKVYGKEYSIKKPTVRQIEEIQSALIDKGGDEQFSEMKKFVSSSGLPVEVIDEMELDHFMMIVDALSGSKKK